MPRFVTQISSRFNALTVRRFHVNIFVTAMTLDAARAFDSYLEQINPAGRTFGRRSNHVVHDYAAPVPPDQLAVNALNIGQETSWESTRTRRM